MLHKWMGDGSAD